MARKKKTKADPEKESGPDDPATSESDGPKKKGGSKKKRTRKKAATKKAAAEARTEAAPEAVTEAEPDTMGSDTRPAALPSDAQVEDLDAALDLDADTPEDIQSLVAEVGAVDEQEDDAGPLEDLDAELEDPGELQRLIAQTVANAEPEDHLEEPSVEPLDDEIPIEVLDDEQVDELAAASTAPPGDRRLRPQAERRTPTLGKNSRAPSTWGPTALRSCVTDYSRRPSHTRRCRMRVIASPTPRRAGSAAGRASLRRLCSW